jgi:hypothetical protein
MQNPFEDLIPQTQGNSQPAQNPFADLIPNNSQPSPQQSAPQEEMGAFNTAGRKALATVATAGRNIGNIPHNLYSGFPQVAPQDYNYYKALGVDKNIVDDLTAGAIEFSPFVRGASLAGEAVSLAPKVGQYLSQFAKSSPRAAEIAAQVGKGSASGAAHGFATSSPEDRGFNTALGGITGAASVPVGMAIAVPFKYGAEKLAQSAIPGLVNKAGNYLKSLPSADYYAQKLKNIFGGAKNEATETYAHLNKEVDLLDATVRRGKKAWKYSPEEQNKLADELENSRKLFNSTGVTNKQLDAYVSGLRNGKPLPDDFINTFNPQRYVDALKKERSQIIKKVGSEANLRDKYKDTVQNIDEWIANPPKTWRDVLRRQEAMNYAPKNYEIKNNAPDEYLKGVVGRGSRALKDSINRSLVNAPLSPLKELFPNATKNYQRVQDFYKAPGKSGELEYSKPLMTAMKGKNDPDSAIFDEFLPSSLQTGVAGLNHLEKLFGNKTDMQNAVKSYFFRKLSSGQTKQDALDLYRQLPDKSRAKLFGSGKDGELLKAAFRAEETLGMPKSFDLKHPASYIPGGAAELFKLMGSKYLSPRSVNSLINYSQSPAKNPGAVSNFLFQSLYPYRKEVNQ